MLLEKNTQVDHHSKAGAMNVMARVSGVMTNSPFILNLDCDMFVNNSKAIQHAMCFFLDCKSERDCGFVQFPQLFYRSVKDDPLGNEMKLFLSMGILYTDTSQRDGWTPRCSLLWNRLLPSKKSVTWSTTSCRPV